MRTLQRGPRLHDQVDVSPARADEPLGSTALAAVQQQRGRGPTSASTSGPGYSRPRTRGKRLARSFFKQRHHCNTGRFGSARGPSSSSRASLSRLRGAGVRLHRERLRLGAGHRLAHRRAPAQRFRSEVPRIKQPPVRVRARAFSFATAPPDRGAGRRRAPCTPYRRVDRHRPGALLIGLCPALDYDDGRFVSRRRSARRRACQDLRRRRAHRLRFRLRRIARHIVTTTSEFAASSDKIITVERTEDHRLPRRRPVLRRCLNRCPHEGTPLGPEAAYIACCIETSRRECQGWRVGGLAELRLARRGD